VDSTLLPQIPQGVKIFFVLAFILQTTALLKMWPENDALKFMITGISVQN